MQTTFLPIVVYLIPLVLIVSAVYSATRFELWKNIWRETYYNVIRLLIFLGGVQLFLFSLMLRLDDRIYGVVVFMLVVWIFYPRSLHQTVRKLFAKKTSSATPPQK